MRPQPQIDESGILTLGITETLKQPRGSALCLAYCTAMLLGYDRSWAWNRIDHWTTMCFIRKLKPEDKHFDKFTDPRFMPMPSAYALLADNKLGLGAFLKASIEDPVVLDEDMILRMDVEPFQQPGLLTVASDLHEGGLHSVVWDNEAMMVRDPAPLVGDLQPLQWYKVIEWFPVWWLGND